MDADVDAVVVVVPASVASDVVGTWTQSRPKTWMHSGSHLGVH